MFSIQLYLKKVFKGLAECPFDSVTIFGWGRLLAAGLVRKCICRVRQSTACSLDVLTLPEHSDAGFSQDCSHSIAFTTGALEEEPEYREPSCYI